jgi:hypothetical protein
MGRDVNSILWQIYCLFIDHCPLVPVIPFTGPVAPAGAVMENNFTGVPVVTS